MKLKTFIIFVIAIAVSALAASHRFQDSAHAMGSLRKGGGVARHPVQLDGRKESVSMIVTARVSPPFRGDARVSLEGAPGYSYAIHNAEPAIRLPFHHRPTFRDNVFYDLRPNDKVAFWLVMKNKGVAADASPPPAGEDSAGPCCPSPVEPAAIPKGKPGQRREGKGPLLAFYDLKSNDRLLTMPIRFSDTGGGAHGE